MAKGTCAVAADEIPKKPNEKSDAFATAATSKVCFIEPATRVRGSTNDDALRGVRLTSDWSQCCPSKLGEQKGATVSDEEEGS